MAIPHIRENGSKKVLVVNDAPYIMIAGEVHNSNSSSVEYMERVWAKAEQLGMNCLLVPVTWEMVEPHEGVFDFSLVDGLIEQARSKGKKLAILWFGSWKNAQCMYAPEWVKTDLIRFKRAQIEKGKNYTFMKYSESVSMPYSTLSYLCTATRAADARAFAALMKHLRVVDEAQQTVVSVQVENETGIQGAAREHSDDADVLFSSTVPQGFVDYMKANTATMVPDVKACVENGAASGIWSEVFGECAEEIFSAYYVSSYVNYVAGAGKAEYPLPMSANCWLDKGDKPGVYPSGGPVARMMEVWKYCAPNIDIIAPDIYVPNFYEVCDQFVKMGNPLYIPETATHSYAASRMLYSFGHHHAVCFAPFGFEEMGEPFTVVAQYLFGVDVNDPALKTPQIPEEYAACAKALEQLMPVITAKIGTNDLQATAAEKSGFGDINFGAYGIRTIYDVPFFTAKNGGCLAVKVADDEFYLIAHHCMLMPYSSDQTKPYIDILAFEEGYFENGEWKVLRRLNGDEATMKTIYEPAIYRLKLFAH